MATNMKHFTKKVICVTTGKEFGSVKECALSEGVSQSCMSTHLRFGEPLHGRIFKKIN